MEIDEKLFHLAWKTKRKFFKKSLSTDASILEESNERLTLFASAFLNQKIKISPAEKNGALIGTTLFLPAAIDIFQNKDLNFKTYQFRVAYESVALELGFQFKEDILRKEDLNLLSLIAAPTILKQTIELYPSLLETLELFKNQIQENIDFQSLKQNSFFNYWVFELIDINLERKLRISKDQKKYISNIKIKNSFTPQDVIQIAKEQKNLIKSLQKKQRCLIDFHPLFSRLATPSQKLLKNSKESNIVKEEKKKEKTVKKTKAKESVKYIEIDEENPDCNPANLLMEGVQTADLFGGGKKMLDGADEMDDHFDAIEDLDIRELTRSSTQTQSIFKSSLAVEVEATEEEEIDYSQYQFKYDEWDYNKSSYRENWCYLEEIKLQKDNSLLPEDQSRNESFSEYKSKIIENNKTEITKLRHFIKKIFIDKRPKNRQIDGPEVDLDAYIGFKSDLASGHSPSQKLYISKRKAPSELSILILLDSSLSSGSWVEGKKVIDISKDSTLIIQEAIKDLFPDVMVASFYSNTRKNCVYNIVKDFDEDWDSNAHKLQQVEPQGYTRIGVALRHSFEHLEKTKSKRKVLLLLSDGKPTDYDAYEGKLGISDVRQCVREANQKDIYIHSLAIDKDSKYYFPQLFGAKNFEVLKTPKNLPSTLIKVLSKII